MAVQLHISTQENHVHTLYEGVTLARTPLAELPTRAAALSEPYANGRTLFAALGGDDLIELLEDDEDELLYLDILAGDAADGLAWECAIVRDTDFLVTQYPLLRLVGKKAKIKKTAEPLQLIALGADALVDKHGNPRETRLDILGEMRDIERVWRESGRAVTAQRIAPTPQALQTALSKPLPTLLHLSCHGSLMQIGDRQQPVLHLEDDNGGSALLMGNDLHTYVGLNRRVRLVLISACHTSQENSSGYGNLTRSLVKQIVPVAIGMNGKFPDHLSDNFAATFYRNLLFGQTVGDSLKSARVTLLNHPEIVGVPICYMQSGGDKPLLIQVGTPNIQNLNKNQWHLPPDLQPPQTLIGRNKTLYELSKTILEHKVVTIVGTCGIGKTALATTFIARQSFHWDDGIIGFTFVDKIVNAREFILYLFAKLIGTPVENQSLAEISETILQNLWSTDKLIFVDNYESVQEVLDDPSLTNHQDGLMIHTLVKRIANAGGQLLFTSRRQPVGIINEVIFPSREVPLQGVDLGAASTIFLMNSPRASEKQYDKDVIHLLTNIGRVTNGHPLAIALLGARYNEVELSALDFLESWEKQLHEAENIALNAHHIKFSTAYSRSNRTLSTEMQDGFRFLTILPDAFYATELSTIWQDLNVSPPDKLSVDGFLEYLLSRSLIENKEIEAKHSEPKYWMIQPTIRSHLKSQMTYLEKLMFLEYQKKAE